MMDEVLTCTMLPDSTIVSCSAATAAWIRLDADRLVGRRLLAFPVVTKDHCLRFLKLVSRLTVDKPSFSTKVMVTESREKVHFVTVSGTGSFGVNGRLCMIKLVCEPWDIVTCVDERGDPELRPWVERHRARLRQLKSTAYSSCVVAGLVGGLFAMPVQPVRSAIQSSVRFASFEIPPTDPELRNFIMAERVRLGLPGDRTWPHGFDVRNPPRRFGSMRLDG